MGSDLYMNPPRDERKIWEKVRDIEANNNALQHENTLLRKTIKDKTAEIESLKVALTVLSGTPPMFVVNQELKK